MVNFTKSEKVPASLAIEKAKPSSENYRSRDVVAQVADDFFDKCYLCEDKNVKDINVEHFEPHKGDRDKMFDWRNLFFACSYCNNIKSDTEKTDAVIPLLNCTDNSTNLLDSIQLRVDVSKLPEKHFIVKATSNDEKTLNTAILLHKIYNEKPKPTALKERGALNLRKRIIEHLIEFEDLITEYKLNVISKDFVKRKLIRQLQTDTAFTTFKVWLVRENDELQEFRQYLPQ